MIVGDASPVDQEKIQMSTAEDACLTKIDGRRLLYAIVEDTSPADQNEEGINVIERNVTIRRRMKEVARSRTAQE